MSNSHDALRALAGAAEAAERRGQDPAQIYTQIEQLAAGSASSSSADCNTSVCGGVIAFGPPAGNVSGLGYCHDCELSAQATEGWGPHSDDRHAPERSAS